ncbi:unnamed protein product, partial [Mesorhabditis spiculigera]
MSREKADPSEKPKGDLKSLVVEPTEVLFPRNAGFNIVILKNNGPKAIAFKVGSTEPSTYLCKPKAAILEPNISCPLEIARTPGKTQLKDERLVVRYVEIDGDYNDEKEMTKAFTALQKSGNGNVFVILKTRDPPK